MVVLSNALPTPALSGSGQGIGDGTTPHISAEVASSTPVYSVYMRFECIIVFRFCAVKRRKNGPSERPNYGTYFIKIAKNTIKCIFVVKIMLRNNKIYAPYVDKRWEMFKFFLDARGKMV